MPRSRRRRVNDRRRDAEQRRIAAEALAKAKKEREGVDRYVRSVFANRAGEVVKSHDGHRYQVQGDGSLVKIEEDKGVA